VLNNKNNIPDIYLKVIALITGVNGAAEGSEEYFQ
jgi:hypothetical protein